MLYMVIERFREGRAPDAWKDLIDFEIVPVRTSAEAVQAIAPRL